MALQYFQVAAAGDVSDVAGTDQFLMTAPAAGVVNVSQSFVCLTEGTGTMTVDGTIDLKVAGNKVGTATYTDNAGVGACFSFVPDGTYATTTDPNVTFDSGDAILVEIGTQATGTTDGDGILYLAMELGK